jgi:hypothetical protein
VTASGSRRRRVQRDLTNDTEVFANRVQQLTLASLNRPDPITGRRTSGDLVSCRPQRKPVVICGGRHPLRPEHLHRRHRVAQSSQVARLLGTPVAEVDGCSGCLRHLHQEVGVRRPFVVEEPALSVRLDLKLMLRSEGCCSSPSLQGCADVPRDAGQSHATEGEEPRRRNSIHGEHGRRWPRGDQETPTPTGLGLRCSLRSTSLIGRRLDVALSPAVPTAVLVDVVRIDQRPALRAGPGIHARTPLTVPPGWRQPKIEPSDNPRHNEVR